jgi:D-tyrosyl-tRNA(Tyr) deacylase
VEKIRAAGLRCETGEFQAMMEVELVNSGPVTILLDSGKLF